MNTKIDYEKLYKESYKRLKEGLKDTKIDSVKLGDFFLNSSFLDFALQYNISNVNRLIPIDIFIQKE